MTRRGSYAGSNTQSAAWAAGTRCEIKSHCCCMAHTVKRACGHKTTMHVGDRSINGFFRRLQVWTSTQCDECESGLPIINNFPLFTAEFMAAHPVG